MAAVTRRSGWGAMLLSLGVCVPITASFAADMRTPMPGASEQSSIIYANPANYLSALALLRAGDTLMLDPGIYDDPKGVPGLPIFNMHGAPGRPIIITGPQQGARAVLRARDSHNTIRIENSSYIIIRNLELDGRHFDVDGVKAQGVSHDITIENLRIRDHDADQQTVGISTKAPAWNWVVRGNVIVGAGTGMYFGNSDGNDPFVAGLIEHNLVVDTIGYNIEIKHQNARPEVPGLPKDPSATIIRHNVFSKVRNSSTGEMARPNLLVGHWPLKGPGIDDKYLIYGNFFYQNAADECLFQGEGNIALYSNIFMNELGDGVCIQPHKAVPRVIHVLYNTVVAKGTGIRVRGGDPTHSKVVAANAIFADKPLSGTPEISGNIAESYRAARRFLTEPSVPLGGLNLFPQIDKLVGEPIDITLPAGARDVLLDFNGRPRDGRTRGAYTASKSNPGWWLELNIKPTVTVASP